MYATKVELKNDVREFTGYTSQLALSQDGLNTAYNRAKRHIIRKKSISDDFEWYGPDNGAARDALFWFTCLFTKIETGELDSQGLQAGAIDADELLAKDDNSITSWYREATDALRSVKSASIIKSSRPIRNGRNYSTDTFGDQSGGSGTEVSGDDLDI